MEPPSKQKQGEEARCPGGAGTPAGQRIESHPLRQQGRHRGAGEHTAGKGPAWHAADPQLDPGSAHGPGALPGETAEPAVTPRWPKPSPQRRKEKVPTNLTTMRVSPPWPTPCRADAADSGLRRASGMLHARPHKPWSHGEEPLTITCTWKSEPPNGGQDPGQVGCTSPHGQEEAVSAR